MTKITYFKSEDCGHCAEMTPIIEKLKQEGYNVRIVDVDKESSKVKYLPNLQICKASKCRRIIGSISEEKLRKLL